MNGHSAARLIETPTRLFGHLGDAWRGIGAEQVALAALLALAAFAQVAVRAIDQSEVLVEAINALAGSIALLLAVVVADHAVDRGAPRTFAYTAAVLLGTGIGVAAQKAHMAYLWDALDDPGQVVAQQMAENPRFVPMRIIGLFLEWLMIGGLATYVYVDRREAHKMATRLHEAEVQRSAQARRVLEAQLQAMQARVDPQFLFNTLAQVKDFYPTRPALGSRMLDDLIAYLRAAMPHVCDTSSMVGQEIALARAYLDIVSLRWNDRIAVHIDAQPDAEAIRMPPMTLLPLIDHAIGDDVDAEHAAGAIAIVCTVDDQHVWLRVVAKGFVAKRDDGRLDGIRERLAALYGARARFDVRRSNSETLEATLECPCEGAT